MPILVAESFVLVAYSLCGNPSVVIAIVGTVGVLVSVVLFSVTTTVTVDHVLKGLIHQVETELRES